MPENHLFEYAVIRIVPKVEREEFLNTGVILYCPKQKFLQTIVGLDETRMRLFSEDLDLEEIKEHLRAFEQVALGLPRGGPISRLDTASRFRWLTATRSTMVQTSKVHPGLCREGFDAPATLARLYQQLVL